MSPRSRALLFALTLVALITLPGSATAQDPFAIEVYDSKIAHRGEWEIEPHLNYIARGGAPTEEEIEQGVSTAHHRTHLAVELTRGLIGGVEVSGYALFARQPSESPVSAGWRLRSAIGAPARWRLPVGLALVAEVGYLRSRFSERTWSLELTPVLDREFGRFAIVLNPELELGFGSRTVESEFEFEPKGRLSYQVNRVLGLNLEYYGSLGEVTEPLPLPQQAHQFFPGIDLHLGDELVWNVAVGFGVTEAGNRLTLKTRFEIEM